MRCRKLSPMWVVAAAAFLLLCPVALAQSADAFNGAWQVTCTPTTSTAALGGDAFDEGMLFESGQFSAQAYAGLGFAPAGYTVDSTGRFSVTLTSPDRGSVVLKGRASGNSLSGYITWTKADGSTFKYRYTGSKIVQQDSGGGE